jgi:hypothetical protein
MGPQKTIFGPIVRSMVEKYKIYFRAGAGAAVIIMLFMGIKSLFSGEEGRVRKFILKGVSAVERQDILTCASMISLKYHDTYGNDRPSALYNAKEFFSYYKKIMVDIESMDITFNEDKTEAGVEMVAFVLCRTRQDTAEKIFEGEKGRIRVKLIKEDNQWHVLEIEFLEKLSIMGQKIS